jgi:betaine reductase
MMALRYALALEATPRPAAVDYVLGCGEEASGDRYQRGGGSLAKAMAEQAGCLGATGADLKAYCCSPIHALALAAATIQGGLFEHVAVVGGGALAKLGMKFRGHLSRQAPILEDVVAATAVALGPPDGTNPVLRLDAVGRYPVGARSTPQALAEHLVAEPLERLGRKILDVDRFALELHDPDVTQTAGSGNVPRNNYRILGSVAVLRGELAAGELDAFERERGMPGFSPTQGHVAAAIPYLGHARVRMLAGEIDSAMFVAKGSLFLGRMTQLSDGLSVLLERNPGRV